MKKFILFIITLTMIASYTQAFAFKVDVVTERDIMMPSEWAESEIVKADEYGILPNDVTDFYHEYIDRAEFAGLIVTCIEKLTGKIDLDAMELTDDMFFNDDESEDVLKAAAIGVVKGVGNGNFAPENKITRQEIAVMMYRAIRYVEKCKGKTFITNNTDISSFTDSAKVATWASEAVGNLCNNGIMKGTSDTTLSPLSNTTKEQAILLDVRIFELMK